MEVPGYFFAASESSASNGSSTVVAPMLDVNNPHGLTESFHFESVGSLPLEEDTAPFASRPDEIPDLDMPEFEFEQFDGTMEFPRAEYANMDVVLQYPVYRNMSTIPEDSDDGDAGDLFQGYDDPTAERQRSSSMSSLEHDEDPDNMRVFYLGENNIRARIPTYVSSEPVSDVDLEDFYRDPNYVPVSTETVAPAVEFEHIPEEEITDAEFETHMADPSIHRTSMMQLLSVVCAN